MERLLAPLALGLSGTLVLVWLCQWQLDRLVWKQGLITGIEARMEAAPVPVPEAPEAARDSLLRVTLRGDLSGEELHVLTATKADGPGFRVIAAVTEDGSGRRLMVDLGYVPERLKEPGSQRAGETAITGFLHWPDEADDYTPDPDLDRGIWFARDVTAMAAALGTDPILVTAAGHDLGLWPAPRPPGVDLPNNHLQYALTWGAMAAVWAVMSLIWARQRWREPPGAGV